MLKLFRRRPEGFELVLDGLDESFDHIFYWTDLKSEAAAAIKETGSAYNEAIQRDGREPLDLVLSVLGSICFRKLQTGADHIYRGVLSGRGEDVKRIFELVVAMQALRGFISVDEAEKAECNVDEAIRVAG